MGCASVVWYQTGFLADNFTHLFSVEFSDSGSRREREEAAYIFFVDYLEECEGNLNMYVTFSVGFIGFFLCIQRGKFLLMMAKQLPWQTCCFFAQELQVSLL